MTEPSKITSRGCIVRRLASGRTPLMGGSAAIDLRMPDMSGILPKLDASDRTHAVMIALKRGILDL